MDLPPALGSPNPYDSSNVKKGEVVLQRLNVGERTPLSPAMSTVLVLCLLYYTLQIVTMIMDYRNENGSKKKNNNRKKTKEKQSLMKRENKKGTVSTVSKRSERAKESQSIILMIAFLVLTVRIRLRVDLESSEPPPHITTVYMCVVVACYIQAFAGDVLMCRDSLWIEKLRCFIRFASFATLYVCVILLFGILINQSKQKNE